MKTRTGKIARLPRAIRNQVNQRLHDGELANRLLQWLNALPEVQTVLAAEFEGRPVNAQNLSDWKQGGYRDWVLLQEALELAARMTEDAVELQAEGRPPLTDTLTLWLAARYAVATRRLRDVDEIESWRLMREFTADIVQLQKGNHSAERLKLEREQFELVRSKEQEKKEVEFWEWAMQTENRDAICKGHLPSAERRRRLAEIFDGKLPRGYPPADGEAPGPAAEPPGQPMDDPSGCGKPDEKMAANRQVFAVADPVSNGTPPPTPTEMETPKPPDSNQGESSLIKPRKH